MAFVLIVLPICLYKIYTSAYENYYGLNKNIVDRVLIISLPLYLLYALRYGYSFTSLIYSLVFSLIFVVIAIDLDLHIIPNSIIIGLLSLGIVNLIVNFVNYRFYLQGFIATFSFMLILYIVTSKGIGGGDVKLLSVLGFLVGIYNIYIILLVSFFVSALTSLVRILFKKATLKTSTPFGPFIALGYFIISFI